MALFLEFLGAIFRFALTGLGAWLVSQDIITPEQSARFLDGAVVGLVLLSSSLLWSLWAKYRGRLKFLGALAAPAGASEDDAKELASMPAIKADAFKTV